MEGQEQEEKDHDRGGRRGRAGRQKNPRQQSSPPRNYNQMQRGRGSERRTSREEMHPKSSFTADHAYGHQETGVEVRAGGSPRGYRGSDRRFPGQSNQYREMDESMDLQLHPLRGSTWAEIFPVLSIFDAMRPEGSDEAEGEGRGSPSGQSRGRGSTRARGFSKNEAGYSEGRRGRLSGRSDRDIELANFRSNRTDATRRGAWPGSPDEEEPRTFWERIAEFNDPQRALGGGISSYHQQLVHLFFLFLALALMHIVHMELYSSYSFYAASRTQASLTLGNMGFSQT